MCVVARGRDCGWGCGHWEGLRGVATRMGGVDGVRIGRGRGGRSRWEVIAGPGGGARGRGRIGGPAAFGRRQWGLVELNGDVAGHLGAAASALRRRPRVGVQVLAAVVTAFRQTGAIQRRVGPVHLFLGVTFHEEIYRHNTSTLERQNHLLFSSF